MRVMDSANLSSHGLICGMQQTGCDVAAIGAVHLDHRIVSLVKFEQAPLGRRPIQVRHALTNQRRGTCWNKENQPFDEELSCGRLAAHIEPQNPEG